ncbi:oligosaccharide flippase family protein [Pedobacter cryophilus]|uniref:Polysaccharide biosynthesis protein n=1 Tax=Pedobacter cryophilus TaxID=2571271 RepID=A0A4U1C4Y1_9SPHI|nr:oligosaccharide flippase family protein [Pedobacter cryophilus]TKC00429.1 polysaccharide biosynthesis protein [Pedobacter cryophilus]
MSKKFASQVVVLVLVNLIIKLIWIFGVERGVQISVGFAEYGLYYSLFNFTFILSAISDPGLSNYLIHSLSIDKINTDHYSSLFFLKLFLSFAFFFIALSLGYLMGYRDDYFELLLLLSVYHFLWSFLIYLRGYLKAHQLFNLETFFSVFDKTLLIALFLPFLYLKTDFMSSIYFFAVSQVIAILISIVLCFFVLKSKGIVLFDFRDFKPEFSVLKKVAPFALFTFLVLAYNKIDTIMLDKMLINGQLETGIYAAAYRLLDASNMLPILFASLFYPVVSQYLALKKDISKLVNVSFEVLFSLSIIIAFACWFYKTELMFFIYGTKSSVYLAQIFGVLMFSSPLVVLFYIFSTVLTANQNLKVLNLISASGLLLNFFINLFLIPKHQALGAAISTLISLFWVGLLYFLYYYRYFKSAINLNTVFKMSALIGLLLGTGYILTFTNFNWLLGLAIYLILALSYTLLLRLFSIKKIKNLIKIEAIEGIN